MASDVSDLTAHLGYWVRQVSNHVSQAFARKLSEKGVTVAEWAMMRVLYGEKPVAPSVLAEWMGMTRGAISKLADRLAVKGLIDRAANADDGRGQTLCLTDQGRRFVPELAALADENEAECFAHLSNDERESLRRVLEGTVRHLGLTTIPTN